MRRLGVAALVATLLAACGGNQRPPTKPHHRPPPTTAARTTATPPPVRRPPPRPIAILPGAHRHGLLRWTPAAAVRGRTAVWISRLGAFGEPGFTVTLLRFDQALAKLTLHAGSSQPGGSGWRYGDVVKAAELRHLIAAFNSGFEESYGAGGFVQDGRVGWPLKPGEASVAIYRDGTADIGRWRRGGFPAPGRPLAAVRQNLPALLIDSGRIPLTVDSCIKVCWGDPLHELPITARSGLGIDAHGQLIWAAGHNLSVRALAVALRTRGAVRAIELDINPAWVAGFLFAHASHHNAAAPIALVPGQTDVDSGFLAPYWRDFFTVLAR